jgi:hypothetical protein
MRKVVIIKTMSGTTFIGTNLTLFGINHTLNLSYNCKFVLSTLELQVKNYDSRKI